MHRKRIYKPLLFLKRKAISPFKRLRIYLKHRLGWLDRPKIVAYRSYGTKSAIEVWAGVMEDRGLSKTVGKSNVADNILAMIKRYTSDELPGVKVRVSFNGDSQTFESDEFGILRGKFSGNGYNFESLAGWKPVRFAMDEEVGDFKGTFSEIGEVLIPPSRVQYGIISDVDDTILVSHATQIIRKIHLMLLKNAHTRKPFPGAAAFYRALHEGNTGELSNPLFYVSSSEWNLYDLLDDFCRVNEFPKGVFLLKEFQSGLVNLIKSGGGNHEHKSDKITHLIEFYESMPFILIGDSGQHDAEIYLSIAKKYPSRIKTVYIRQVKKKKNRRKMEMLRQEYARLGVDFLVVKSSYEAAIHAVQKGYIQSENLNDISSATYGDKQAPGDLKTIVHELKENDPGEN